MTVEKERYLNLSPEARAYIKELEKQNRILREGFVQLVRRSNHTESKNIILRRHNEELAYEAFVDEITGLYNRKRFNIDLHDAVSHSAGLGIPISLVMLDLNGFKPVNDIYGHDAGDDVLRRVGEKMFEKTRSSDSAYILPNTEAYRKAGDEFFVILPASDEINADKVADRLCNSIAEIDVNEKKYKPLIEVPGDKKPEIGACSGIATYKPKDLKHLISRYERRYKRELNIKDEDLSKYVNKVSERLCKLADHRMLYKKAEMKKQGLLTDRAAYEAAMSYTR
ncbi:MAG: GGDEF domain-containing protein [Candidatus Aenigmarchaeota archaeon]|nr:GGDEF domain-containing protein [Candidatus Aenigmarchaeota archaeon]